MTVTEVTKAEAGQRQRKQVMQRQVGELKTNRAPQLLLTNTHVRLEIQPAQGRVLVSALSLAIWVTASGGQSRL
jgi:hypothetical protein